MTLNSRAYPDVSAIIVRFTSYKSFDVNFLRNAYVQGDVLMQ